MVIHTFEDIQDFNARQNAITQEITQDDIVTKLKEQVLTTRIPPKCVLYQYPLWTLVYLLKKRPTLYTDLVVLLNNNHKSCIQHAIEDIKLHAIYNSKDLDKYISHTESEDFVTQNQNFYKKHHQFVKKPSLIQKFFPTYAKASDNEYFKYYDEALWIPIMSLLLKVTEELHQDMKKALKEEEKLQKKIVRIKEKYEEVTEAVYARDAFNAEEFFNIIGANHTRENISEIGSSGSNKSSSEDAK